MQENHLWSCDHAAARHASRSRERLESCANLLSVRATKMELVFAKFAFLLYFLNTVTASVDISLENDDLIRSPFSEHTGSDVHSYTVFTKEELSKYNGEDVSAAVNCVDVAFLKCNCFSFVGFAHLLRSLVE